MLSPAWLWTLVTIVALVISVIALVNGISARGRVEAITKKTENLEKDIEQCRNALNQERERLEKIESEQLRRKEAADILNRISALKQNITELEGRKQNLQAEIKVQEKLHDQQHEELKRLVSERQQQESLRQELAILQDR